MRRLRIGLGLLLAAAIAPAAQARTETYYLGTFANPATVPIGDSQLIGFFTDSFPFTIASGNSFQFSSSFATGFNTYVAIGDMNADLVRPDGSIVEAGDATTTFTPEGFPSRNVAFDPIALAAGDYSLDVLGTAAADFPGPTAQYSGTIDLDLFPIPEPDAGASLLAGLGLIGGAIVAAKRRPRA